MYLSPLLLQLINLGHQEFFHLLSHQSSERNCAQEYSIHSLQGYNLLAQFLHPSEVKLKVAVRENLFFINLLTRRYSSSKSLPDNCWRVGTFTASGPAASNTISLKYLELHSKRTWQSSYQVFLTYYTRASSLRCEMRSGAYCAAAFALSFLFLSLSWFFFVASSLV
jgi:hypothetical protein